MKRSGGYVRYRPLRYPALLAVMKPILRRLNRSVRRNPRLSKLGRFLELGPLQKFVLYNACDTLPGDLAPLGLTETGAPRTASGSWQKLKASILES